MSKPNFSSRPKSIKTKQTKQNKKPQEYVFYKPKGDTGILPDSWRLVLLAGMHVAVPL